MTQDWTLIKDAGEQRYYQLNFRIRNGSTGCPGKTIQKIFKVDPLKLLDEYELAEDISESVDKVCVSDAHTHVERLVFPAFYIRDKTTGEKKLIHRCNSIDGIVTMMIYGGDESAVYPDETYLRHLRMINRPGGEGSDS
jgi:hypothetical protein